MDTKLHRQRVNGGGDGMMLSTSGYPTILGWLVSNTDAQGLSRRISPVQINCVRLTYGHYNLLIQLNYNDSLELIKSLIMLNSGEIADSGKLSDSPSLGDAKYFADEKGSISNSTLWDVADFQHKKNQSVNRANDIGSVRPANTITQCNPVNQLSLRGVVRHLCGTERAAQNYPENIGPVYSLGFFRCRRLISPCIAVTINCPVLSPSSFTSSIASTTSCGARACTFCDLLLIALLAISSSPFLLWITLYRKENEIKLLTWSTIKINVDYTLMNSMLIIAKPQGATNTIRASHHNVIEAYTMAIYHSTQTQPKFIHRSLAGSVLPASISEVAA